MKRSILLGAALVLAVGTAGCNSSRIAGHSRSFNAPPRAPTYALAVTVHGGLPPTPVQWAAIQARFAQELSWRGAVLVSDISLADKIIRVDFLPDTINPDTHGHLVVLGVRTNPYSGIASTTRVGPYSSSLSFARSFSNPRGWGAADYYSGDYFNYIGPWENGYTSGSTTIIANPTPPTTTPPHRRRPRDGEFCPPDALHPRTPPTFASNEAPRMAIPESKPFVNMSPAAPEPSSGRPRWTGERSAWRSDPAARGSGTYARSEASVPRVQGGRWRSGRSSDADSGRSSRSERSYSSPSSSSGSSFSDSSYSSPSPSFSGSDSSSGGSFSSSSSYPSAPPAATMSEAMTSRDER